MHTFLCICLRKYVDWSVYLVIALFFFIHASWMFLQMTESGHIVKYKIWKNKLLKSLKRVNNKKVIKCILVCLLCDLWTPMRFIFKMFKVPTFHNKTFEVFNVFFLRNYICLAPICFLQSIHSVESCQEKKKHEKVCPLLAFDWQCIFWEL